MKRKYELVSEAEEGSGLRDELQTNETERHGSELRMFVTDQFAPWVAVSRKPSLRPEIISSTPVENYFVRLPTRTSSSQVRVYEQTGSFPQSTEWGQRLFVTNCTVFRSVALQGIQAMLRNSLNSLAVLFHMHKFPNTNKGTRGSNPTKAFFLSQEPHLASEEEIALVKTARNKLCNFQGDRFLGLHCQKTLVEFLFGNWNKNLPNLILKGSITDTDVHNFITKPPAPDIFKIPFFVRKRNTRSASWCCLQNKDSSQNHKLLSKPLQAFFAGIYLSLQMLWEIQKSSSHPFKPAQGKENLQPAIPPAKIKTYCVESRDELTVIGKHLIFCLENLDHLWLRYFHSFENYISTFAKAPKVWLELEHQRLCLSVQINL